MALSESDKWALFKNIVLFNFVLASFFVSFSLFSQHKTIDGVLERGVKLDQLVDKSNDLSNQSKMFYKQAKKTNACCVIA